MKTAREASKPVLLRSAEYTSWSTRKNAAMIISVFIHYEHYTRQLDCC